MSDLATDIRVDFIKYEQPNQVLSSQSSLDREHDSRDFAARRDCAQRFQRLTGIRRKLKFDAVGAIRPNLFEVKPLQIKPCLGESQVREVPSHFCNELRAD